MAGHGEKISRNRERAISALLSSPSIPEAAKASGLSERSLYRWLQDEEFQETYQAARREVVKHAVTTVQAAMSKAVETLREIMEDTDAPASARVSAARAVLDLGLKATEIEDLQRRVAEIEALLKGGEREA